MFTEPNCKARYSVTRVPKYQFSQYFVYLFVYKPNQVAKYKVTAAQMYRNIQ